MDQRPLTVLFVCGERSRGDDGAALAAVDLLAPADLAGVDVRVVGQLQPEHLLAVAPDQPVVIADAVSGVPPGRLVDLPLDAVGAPTGPAPASSHALPIRDVLGIVMALDGVLPSGRFVGIGVASVELGASLSEPVRDRLRACADRIAGTLRDVRGPSTAAD